MPYFHARTRLDKTFKVGLLLKGVDGLIEAAGGLFFLFVQPVQVHHFVFNLVAPELGEDPHDFFARHLLHWSQSFTKGAAIFASVYLLSHGLVKLILVVAIMREHLWAYLGLIIVTAGFVVYQLIHIVQQPTFTYIALTVFDVIIIALTVMEYGHQKERLRLVHQTGGDEEGRSR